jgi:Tfp pilus assembly protein PilE
MFAFSRSPRRQLTSASLRPRTGLTLIEIMVAMVMTLVILLAMIQAFRYANEEIAKGRAMIELSNQMRATQETLRSDLEGVTANMQPAMRLTSPSGSDGYFEYIEGPTRDNSAVLVGRTTDSVFGDVDDVLCFTTRSDGQPFRGRSFIGGTTTVVESSLAEVVWWTDFVDNPPGNSRLDYDESLFIRRRVLLIRPDIDLSSVPAASFNDVKNFFLNNDISARWVDSDNSGTRDRLVANSLGDLDKRENRFAHFAPDNNLPIPPLSAYPHALNRLTLAQFKLSVAGPPNLSGQQVNFAGNDVANTDTCCFDVKIYSPLTRIRDANATVFPSDPGYASGTGLTAFGAFVDLNYTGNNFSPSMPEFSTLPQVSPQNPAIGFAFNSVNWLNNQAAQEYVVDTFTRYYETNGVDDDVVDGVDQLFMNPTNNSLRETLPPYPFAITGIEVTLGVHERTTKQVRRTSTVVKFAPEN